MKTNNYLLSLSAAVLVLAGCSSKNNGSTDRVSNAAATINENVPESGIFAPGIPLANYDVKERKISIDGKDMAFASVNESTFEGFLSLWTDVSEVNAVTRAVETKEQRLELYAGSEVVMVLDLHAAMPTIAYTRAGFHADKITFAKNASEQSQGLAVVSFDMKSCRVEQQQEQQEQEQKQLDQGQGSVMVEAGSLGGEQSQGQQPVQEQKVAPMEKAETCKTVSTWIGLGEIIVEQKQEQEAPKQEEPKQEVAPLKEEQAPVKEEAKQEVAPLKEEQAPVKEEAKQEVAPLKEEKAPLKEEAKQDAPIAPQETPAAPSGQDGEESVTDRE